MPVKSKYNIGIEAKIVIPPVNGKNTLPQTQASDDGEEAHSEGQVITRVKTMDRLIASANTR